MSDAAADARQPAVPGSSAPAVPTTPTAADPTVTPTADEERANELAATLSEHHNALPYLFIGSGISRRYLGLPDWEGLLSIFATEVGENFNFHLSSANGDYPKAASSVAAAFHPHWWTDAAYSGQVAKYQDTAKGRKDGALKAAISEYVRQREELVSGVPGVDDPDLAVEVELLRKAVVDGVITTNYDSLTDQLFPAFNAYVGQEELMFSDAQFIAETYKIHGSAERPESIVLTAEDYTQFSERNHYLAAKLLTIFAEHPVLFVGYSLSDEYLGEILANIATAVGQDRLKALGERIYFVEWNPDPSFVPVVETANLERGPNNSRLPITRIETHSFAWIWSALGRLERPFPAGVLRELRKHVFDLVTHPEPGDSREVVRSIPIDAADAAGVRVVFGVGQFSDQDLEDLSSISARTLTRADIEEDILGIRERPLDAENVLKFGIPDMIRPRSTDTLPVFKYLRDSRRIDLGANKVSYKGLKPIIRQLATRKIGSHSKSVEDRFHRDVEGKLTTPGEIMASGFSTYFKLECLLQLDAAAVDLDELRDVLVDFYGSPDFARNASYFRKVLVRYDRLRAREAVLAARAGFDA